MPVISGIETPSSLGARVPEGPVVSRVRVTVGNAVRRPGVLETGTTEHDARDAFLHGEPVSAASVGAFRACDAR